MKSSRHKNARHTNRSGAGERKSLLCDLGSELRPGGREKRRAKTTKRMGKNKKNEIKNNVLVEWLFCDFCSLSRSFRTSTALMGDTIPMRTIHSSDR